MKRFSIALASLILATFVAIPANAVENGEDASGSPFVVPILNKINSTQSVSCSGALIAPSIVVTAGHCVLDINGLVSKSIYVGKAGSSMLDFPASGLAVSVSISSTFRNAADNKVGDDDLAFIVLGKAQQLSTPIRLASEAEVNSFKSGNVALNSFGYGAYADVNSDPVTMPKSFSGSFSPKQSSYANSAYMLSTSGNACLGDSGSPIVTSTATSVILVGILTGSEHNHSCSKRSSDGNYYTLFTLISRYSNLAFASAVAQMKDMQSQLDALATKAADLTLTKRTLEDERAASAQTLDNANKQIEDLTAQITSLQARRPITISCLKGKTTWKITGVNPKCPSGFKPKA